MTIQYDFNASVGYWATIVSIAFRRALNDELAPLGITHRQAQVLAWLVHEGNLSQCELASRMDIEASTLTGILDRMEHAGWLERIACVEDRRRKIIQMAPEAAPVWEKIAECAIRVRTRATAGLDEAQADQLRSMLEIVHQNLIQQGAQAPAADANCQSHTQGVWVQ
ncbi:MarR family winged helix-turn-helix transcriptional regulator [Planctomicrobium sp. SH661]|uniref:MarR family winged helix-turn-helix transcriptional regulator n=1 Tax=Planctomicrobium sp. SH661 TaxID=3448124 RepID=UPI003F5B1721